MNYQPRGINDQALQGPASYQSQIEAANRAFTPAAGEVAWARTIVGAFDSPENAAKGVLRVEGRMVERLHLDEARRLIAVADAIAARG